MAYTLTQLAADIRETLKSDTSPAGKDKVCALVSRSLNDKAFVATHLKERAPGANPREVLYEDPELGFCICGHVYSGPAHRLAARSRLRAGRSTVRPPASPR